MWLVNYASCRASLTRTFQEHVESKLDPTLFPYVKDAPSAAPPPTVRPTVTTTQSLRSAKPSWHRPARPGAGNGAENTKQRLFLFIAGGMTYSEMREVYQLSAALNKDIYIGTPFYLLR